MNNHTKPFACGRCIASGTSSCELCESPRVGCRCEECVGPSKPTEVTELRAEVERLTKERDAIASEGVRLVREMKAEVERLRGLIAEAESADGHCPWCDSHGVDLAACGHFPDCSAFSARGEVRRKEDA